MPSKKPCPPSLLAVRDLIERYPAERTGVLSYEISRRERERLICGSTRQLIHFQLWGAAKSLLVTGAIVFILLFMVSRLRDLGAWMADTQKTLQQFSLLKTVGFDAARFLPSKETIDLLTGLPAISWREAGLFALLAMIVVFTVQILMAFVNWRKTAFLKEAVDELDEEIDLLKQWKNTK